jgi:hypothetical protein
VEWVAARNRTDPVGYGQQGKATAFKSPALIFWCFVLLHHFLKAGAFFLPKKSSGVTRSQLLGEKRTPLEVKQPAREKVGEIRNKSALAEQERP